MLLFACSGLDSTIKHLIRDALPRVVDQVPGAEANFKRFAQRRLRSGESSDLLAAALTSRQPRRVLLDELIDDLTSASLQSIDQVLRCGSYFDLRSRELIENEALFRELFHARNQIAHEMDIDFSQPRRNRATRGKDQFVQYTTAVLGCATRFLRGVDAKLQPGE